MTARILVTGSRNWTDRGAVRDALLRALGVHGWHEAVLVVGDATGADAIAAELWAADLSGSFRLGPIEHHVAEWRTEGRAAGPRRNQRMVDAGATVCLAFPLERSKGTWDCIHRANEAGIPVVIVPPSTPTAPLPVAPIDDEVPAQPSVASQ